MITIKCTEPVCGKEFQFDDEKNLNAKKARCPYCKGIVDLTASESKIIKPNKDENIASASIPITPISTKEDNFNLQPKVNFPTTPVTSIIKEPEELPSSGINYKWLVLGGIGLILLFFMVCRVLKTTPIAATKPIFVMPDYKIMLDDYNVEYALNSNIVLSGFIQPKLDPYTSVLLTANRDTLILDSLSRFEFTSKFTNKTVDTGVHIVNFILKCGYHDSIFKGDTQNVNFKILSVKINGNLNSKKSAPKSTSKIVKDLYNLASEAFWYINNKRTAKIELNGGSSPDGYLSNESNVILENDKSYSKGITICLAKKSQSSISGEFEFSPIFLSNISGEWGFGKLNEVNDKSRPMAELEITQYFEDGSTNIYHQRKVYDSKLLPISMILQNSKKTIMIKIKVVSINRSKTPLKVFIKNTILR